MFSGVVVGLFSWLIVFYFMTVWPFSIDGHLGCFQFVAVTKSATVNTLFLGKYMCGVLRDSYLGVRWLVLGGH